MVNLNFSKTPSNDPLEEDRIYGAEILSATLGTSQGRGEGASPGNPVLRVDMRVTEDAGDNKATDRRITEVHSLQDHALFSVESLLTALGNEISRDPDVEFMLEPEELVGQNVAFSAVNNDYLGEPRSSVRRYYAARFGGMTFDEMFAQTEGEEASEAVAIPGD